MEQLIPMFLFVIAFCVLVAALGYVCQRFAVPQPAQWIIAAFIIVALLYALLGLVGSRPLHFPIR